MARLIMLMAKRPFRHHGRLMAQGEVFQASAIDAVALTYHGQAVLAPAKKVAAPLPVAKVSEPALPTLIAESVAAEDPVKDALIIELVDKLAADMEWPAQDAGSPPPEEPKPKRRYKRRDLEAEDSHEPV